MEAKCIFCNRMQPPENIRRNDNTGEMYTESEYQAIQKYLRRKRQNKWWRELFRWAAGIEVKDGE